MKAFSLWQPWASAIAAGLKTIETRSWGTSYRGPLAIHAAKRFTSAEFELWSILAKRPATLPAFRLIGVNGATDLPLGAIVATCEIYGCVSTNDAPPFVHRCAPNEMEWGNFSPNRYAWMLRNVQPIISGDPCVGHQGFWEWEGSR